MSFASSLSVPLLVIYLVFLLPGIYVTFKHGFRHGAVLGWIYLCAFFLLRIVSSGLLLQKDAKNTTTAALVANIGLSPLLLATCGIIHEARAYLIANRRRWVETLAVVVFHQQIAAAIALVAVGASDAASATDPDDIKKNQTLAKVGEILLLLGWVALIAAAISTAVTASRKSRKSSSRRRRRSSSGADAIRGEKSDITGGKVLIFAVCAAMPFLGIRLLTALVYFFTEDAALAAASGNVGLKVGLEVVNELIVSLLFLIAGFLTRGIGKEGARYQQQPAGSYTV